MTMTVIPVRGRVPRRVAMVSVHTSPLDQPGTGDAGGMNVYVVELARRLAALDVEVGPITRATSSRPAAGGRAGARRHGPARHGRPVRGAGQGGPAGPAVRLHLGRDAARGRHEPGWYDLVHSHYWLSGQVGWLAARALGRAARALDAHDGEGQERSRCADGRRPGAGRPRDRRGAGRRGRRPAGRQHRRGGRPARRALRRRPRPGRASCRRASTSTSSRRARAASPARRSASPDDAYAAAVRRPDPAAQGARRAAARGRPAASRRGPSLRERLVVAVVGGPSGTGLARPSRCSRWPPSSASPTWCGSCRRCRRPSSPTGTAPPTSPSCRRTASRSAWWPSSRRPAARRSSRPRSAGCAPRSPTACPACCRRPRPPAYADVLGRPGRRPRPARRPRPRRAAARRPVRLGRDGGRDARGLLRRAARARRRTRRWPSAGDARAGHRRVGPARGAGRARARGAHARHLRRRAARREEAQDHGAASSSARTACR